MRTSKTIIFTAPAGWGKTTRAQALLSEFGCSSIVDEWNPSMGVTPGALHLTNMPPRQIQRPEGCMLIARGWDASPPG